MVLASTVGIVSLEELATLADKVMDVAAQAVHTPQIAIDVELLCAEVSQLKDVISSFTNSQGNQATPPIHALPLTLPFCLYHQRFGKEARKCRPPCSRSGNNLASR